ncbi:hypothetical protein AAG570_009245 [Ranatra chinensis]|uniref:Reverse transcriptase RNase H-like domain-containing protein n=1 Tax=Ranatra chinensis TaxID=642074 RepID=A0ABD0YTA5_9HEMI
MDEFLEGMDEGDAQGSYSQLDQLRDRPVAFVSRKLTPTESRYSVIERELLGVVWAVEYFRPYLFGRQFLIKTDHKPLVWVGGLKETSARGAHWKDRLAAYSFTISHNKRKDNVVADCLSRMVNALSRSFQKKASDKRFRGFFRLSISPFWNIPKGKNSNIPGLDLLRRRVVEEPDHKTVEVPTESECVKTGRVRVINANGSRPPRTRQPLARAK